MLPARYAERPRAGLFFWGLPAIPLEPAIKRAIIFVDGQNLYRSAKEAFGYIHPNYDVQALSQETCNRAGWTLQQVRFYTGIPDQQDDAFWHYFWTGKMAVMGRQKVVVYSRSLRYHNIQIKLPDGTIHTKLVGREKGIDVRIALDVIRLAHHNEYDVAVIFSQDQDLTEVAAEIRVVASEQNRWIRIASAFPSSPTMKNKRGVNNTEWIPIDRALYDKCLDLRDYRPSGSSSSTSP